MIKIALCDDNEAARTEVSELVEGYSQKRGQELKLEVYHAALDLLSSIEHGARFDVLILDILMPGFDGIRTAAEIRRFDSCVKIIFLTSSPDFAVQSYTVNAFYYILKPIDRGSLFKILDSALDAVERDSSDGLILQCKDGITHIGSDKLEYCEVMHRTLYIHLTTGEVLESVGSLDGLEKQLSSQPCFSRFHRSYLVNLNHIRNISRKSVTMSSLAEIPVPRGKYNEIKDAFLENAFSEANKP